VAAALAVIAVSVSLYPVFTGLTWFWCGVVSVIVVAATGTLTRLRRLPAAVTVAAYVAALLLWLNLAFSNARSLWHLLPTPASLAALFDIAGQGFDEAAKYAPPAPELRGMVLLAAAGIGIIALLTDLIAVRLESAALAGLPLLLLFTEPFTLSVARGFAGTAIAFCAGVAGYLALLSSEARDRIREWEHPDPATRAEPDTGTLAAAGRRVGFASVVLALCLPLFIPGLHATRLFGGQPGIGGGGGAGGGGGGAGVVGFPNPSVQLFQELHTAQPQDVLTYTTSDPYPGYLQVYTLDQLTGNDGWQMYGQPRDLVPVSPALPAPPGLTGTGPWVTRQTTNIAVDRSVGSDAFGALPLPYPATSVRANGTLTADKSTLMVFDNGASLGGLSYTVTGFNESPTYEQVAAAPPPAESISAHYLSVPPSYGALRALAQAKTAGAATRLQQAVDLQDWLSGASFKYTLDAPTVLSAPALTRFLEVTKAGYCQQFSFAMAVLARLLGIPARVAIGFTQGVPQNADTGSYLVTSHDAHAWPELYFQGYGWLRFEPTPNGSTGQASASPPVYTSEPAGGGGTGQTQPALPASPAATAAGGAAHHVQTPLPPSDLQSPGNGSSSPWEAAGLVVAGLILVLTIAPRCARGVIRRRRWHRGAGGPGAGRADRVRARDIAWAHAAWAELRDDLTDYGAPSRPSESPRAVAARAGTGLRLAEQAQAALARIAMAEERARYAPAPADGSGLRADSAAVRRAIAAAVPREARWRARLFPASVVTPALNALASVADLYRGSRGGSPR
jgi:transglutaminase-like putative cysteine protease